MTLHAEPRIGNFKEPVIDRAMGLVAVGTTFHDRSMLPEKRAASLCMASVAVLVDALLDELGRIGCAVRVVATGTGQLPFGERHMGGAHELRLSLQMARAAKLILRALVGEDSLVADLGELEAVGGLLHERVTIHASDPAAGMGAGFPIGLHAALVALEAALVLRPGRLSGVLAEADQPSHALSSSRVHVIAAGAVAGLAGLLLLIVASVEEKDLPHHGLGEFLKLRGVASLADLIACICSLLSGLRLCGPRGSTKT